MIRILKGIRGEGFSIYRYDDQELMCLTVIHKGAFHFIPASWEIAV